MTPEARYADLVRAISSHAGVTQLTEGKGFGSSGQLKINGRIFAMLVRDELVVKLPRRRVDELIAQGEGRALTLAKESRCASGSCSLPGRERSGCHSPKRRSSS